jgi:hypothetical protein
LHPAAPAGGTGTPVGDITTGVAADVTGRFAAAGASR